jgi:alkylation response protein AidB-like acyl-CoA dehydrogenase
MDLPGIEVRPLRTIMGSSEFSEVFLNDVRVPVESLVGAENDGWRVTNVTLRFERGTAFSAQIYRTGEMIDELIATAKRVTRLDAAAWEDRELRREVGRLRAELDSLWALVKLSISQASSSGVPSLSSSCIKLHYSDLWQRTADVAARVIGRAGLVATGMPGVSERAFGLFAVASISMGIAAGSSQIQRNIISERILGLPRGA